MIGNRPFWSSFVFGYPLTSRAGAIHIRAFASLFVAICLVFGYPLTSRAGVINSRHMTNFAAMDRTIRNLLSLCQRVFGV